MSQRVYINAQQCAAYLRTIGVDVDAMTEGAWAVREAEHRATRRANRAELKRSCGHFRTHWTKVVHEGGCTNVKYCSDCRVALEYSGASLGYDRA